MTVVQGKKGCVAINWSKKKCYLLSEASNLEDKRGWTAGMCVGGSPPGTTSPTLPTETLPTGTLPTGTLPPVTGATTPGGECTDEFYKNQAYDSSKATQIGKPAKSNSPEDCLEMCKVRIKDLRKSTFF